MYLLIPFSNRYDVSGAQTWMLGRAYRGVIGYVEQVNPGSDPRQRALCTNECEVKKSYTCANPCKCKDLPNSEKWRRMGVKLLLYVIPERQGSVGLSTFGIKLTGQLPVTVEHSKSKSTQPSLRPIGTPCSTVLKLYA